MDEPNRKMKFTLRWWVPMHARHMFRFRAIWEPDSLVPLFIIDHFAKNGLMDKFNAIARFAEKRKDMLSTLA